MVGGQDQRFKEASDLYPPSFKHTDADVRLHQQTAVRYKSLDACVCHNRMDGHGRNSVDSYRHVQRDSLSNTWVPLY